MPVEIVGLSVCRVKGNPPDSLAEARLAQGLGLEGDFRQGGEKQVSLLPAEARRWMEAQPEQGLCFRRFRENISIQGLATGMLEPGSLLSVGDAILRISAARKECFDECPLYSRGIPCNLSQCAAFASVERSGAVRLHDPVSVLPGG